MKYKIEYDNKMNPLRITSISSVGESKVIAKRSKKTNIDSIFLTNSYTGAYFNVMTASLDAVQFDCTFIEFLERRIITKCKKVS